MTYSEVRNLGLSLTELKQLKRNVQMLIEDQTQTTLGVNTKVTIDSPKAKGIYTITKMNRKTATIKNTAGKRFKATITMLIPV